ncbi:MAG: aminotransferase class I/II-fold pyridoxal phosphate-dependent enzyme [Candidatus Palauibacterales bacterium]|nr:aminotransferase class I/II-fold pyridoxal phosphate-dependent enzyme [Candidatus Palauibacterales bacterium]MDP2482900.1 aminotransferase class I/II-fold pyridoxal phosphate-dependent enzyme [Candidatus Palauibacterales bacterium]
MGVSRRSLDTRLIHAGEIRPGIEGAVELPIFQSANFESVEGEAYHDIKYMRLGNSPNHAVLSAKLAALEGAEAALVAASGMAAITSVFHSLLSVGDHVIFQDCLYGGTYDYARREFARHGLTCDFVDGERPGSWGEALRPETRLIYVETITNPLVQVADLESVVAFAREHGLISVIDNTFASPVNFRPTELGFDLSLHSGTKYLNGHSDIVCGAVIGRAGLVARVKRMMNYLGGSLDAHACFLLHRGLKTLAVRVRQQNESALTLARALEAHPAVARVNYPGLPSNPGHERAARLFDGFGGMLSFELDGGAEAAKKFLDAVEIAIVAPSLGGVETLVTMPAATSHAGLTADERRQVGVADGLIRVSTGVEGAADLVADFEAALAAL